MAVPQKGGVRLCVWGLISSWCPAQRARGDLGVRCSTGWQPASSFTGRRLCECPHLRPPGSARGPAHPTLQDPKERPSAADLLLHPFVAGAAKPAELQDRVAGYLASRPQLGAGQALPPDPAAATLPRWDFADGANGSAAAAEAAVAPPLTGTVVASAGKPPRPSSLTNLQQRPATAPDGLATAVAAGTVKASATAADGTLRRHTESDLTGTVHVKQPAPAAVAAGPAVGPVVADSAATVLGTAAGLPPSGRRIVIPNDPRVPDSRDSGALGGDGMLVASGRAVPRISGVAGTPAADSGPIRLLVQPALASAAGANSQAAAAAEATLVALAALEAAQPGATRSALTDMLAMLSVSTSPSLLPLKYSAAAVFGGGSGEACGAGLLGPDGSTGLGTPADLGPLGNFLLARWRESAARERAESGGRPWPNGPNGRA